MSSRVAEIEIERPSGGPDGWLPLSAEQALDPALAGNKGANLARLSQAGFPVPAAVVLAIGLCDRLRSGRTGRPELLAILSDALAALPPAERFAVRSSSTSEDSHAAAHAGQFTTHLDVEPGDAMADAVLDCLDASGMAIILQVMVDARIAGVMFTMDPLTGGLGDVLIESHPGIGTAVVEGQGKPAHHAVSKQEPPDGGAPAAAAPWPQAELEGRHLAALRDAAVEIERLFAYPQDIEWAADRDRLWIVQARPVTAVPEVLTRDESAERFPNAVTPLAWEVISDIFHQSLDYSLAAIGLPAFRGRWFVLDGHYVYGNQCAMEVYRSALSLSARRPVAGETTLGGVLANLAWVRRPTFFWSQRIDSYLVQTGRFRERIEAAATLEEAWALVEEMRGFALDYFRPNIAISMGHGILVAVLERALATAVPDEGARQALQTQLTAGVETRTRQVAMDLAELAECVRPDPDLLHGLRTLDPPEALARLMGDARAGPAARRLLEAHGHRELDHFLDPFFPTLAARPEQLVSLLQPYLGATSEDGRHGPSRVEREERVYLSTLAAILPLVPAEERANFLTLLSLARRYIELDDVEHYHTTRLQLLFARVLDKIGAQLRADSKVHDPLDIYFATFAELRSAAGGTVAAGWKDRLRATRTEFEAACGRQPPWGLGAAATDGRDFSGMAGEGSLSGRPCSGGVAEGPVFVVRSISDLARFPEGAILVAEAALPAWTPLFPLAAAIVTEGGGPLSHAAIVARELSIPAVMGVPNLIACVRSGMTLHVDGGRGAVSVVEERP